VTCQACNIYRHKYTGRWLRAHGSGKIFERVVEGFA
jgi:hypothetical protein